MALVWGVVPCWASILPIILRPINIDQWTSGLIGTYGQIFCAILSFVFALYAFKSSSLCERLKIAMHLKSQFISLNLLFALLFRQIIISLYYLQNYILNSIQDRFMGYMRLSIISLNLLGAAAFTIFCLSANHVLPYAQSMSIDTTVS